MEEEHLRREAVWGHPSTTHHKLYIICSICTLEPALRENIETTEGSGLSCLLICIPYRFASTCIDVPPFELAYSIQLGRVLYRYEASSWAHLTSTRCAPLRLTAQHTPFMYHCPVM